MKNIAICDDDKKILQTLQNYLIEFSNKYELDLKVDTYTEATSLIKVLKQNPNQYLIIFLDIIMEPLDGINCARLIRTLNEDVTIAFLSSSPDYAIDGYSVNAKTYMLKPFDTQLLERELFEYFFENTLMIQIPLGPSHYRSLDIQHVEYIESSLRKVRIYYDDNTLDEFYSKISTLLSLLPQHQFVQCHKSFIANLSKVDRVNKTSLTFKSGKSIPISRRSRSSVIQKFLQLSTIKSVADL